MAGEGQAKVRRFALWALPHETQVRWFTETIHDLARRGEGNLFPPHVTLASGDLPLGIRPDRFVEALAVIPPFSLNVRGLVFGKTFFQAIVIALGGRSGADQIETKIAPLVPGVNIRRKDLHLSLYYGNRGETELRQLCPELNLPFQHIHFSRIQLVSPLSGWRAIQDWVVLAEAHLTSEV